MNQPNVRIEQLKRISITNMKHWGYLDPKPFNSGTVIWSTEGIQTSSIEIISEIGSDPPRIWLRYVSDGEWVNDRISLVRIPSNIGKGFLWYFVCPSTGKRCRVLYLYRSHFVSRNAVPGWIYQSQCYSRKWKPLFAFVNLDRIKVPKTIRYKGKLTKRFLRFRLKKEKLNRLLEGLVV